MSKTTAKKTTKPAQPVLDAKGVALELGQSIKYAEGVGVVKGLLRTRQRVVIEPASGGKLVVRAAGKVEAQRRGAKVATVEKAVRAARKTTANKAATAK